MEHLDFSFVAISLSQIMNTGSQKGVKLDLVPSALVSAGVADMSADVIHTKSGEFQVASKSCDVFLQAA